MSRIRENKAVFAGDSVNQPGCAGIGSSKTAGKKDTKKQENKKNVFAGEIEGDIWKTIQRKKELARKEATKVILDKFESDNVTSDKISELDSHKEELKAQAKEAVGWLSYFDEEKESLKEMYSITEKYEAGSNSEYEERLAALQDEIDDWQRKKDSSLLEIAGEGQIISALKQSKLGEQYTMTKAMAQAEEILDAASSEIIGLLQKDAMEHVTEELKKKVEKAEERAAEKEEMEKRLEEIKEEKENKIEQLESLPKAQGQMQETIDEIKREAELLEEDMKGLLVDVSIY